MVDSKNKICNTGDILLVLVKTVFMDKSFQFKLFQECELEFRRMQKYLLSNYTLNQYDLENTQSLSCLVLETNFRKNLGQISFFMPPIN